MPHGVARWCTFVCNIFQQLFSVGVRRLLGALVCEFNGLYFGKYNFGFFMFMLPLLLLALLVEKLLFFLINFKLN